MLHFVMPEGHPLEKSSKAVLATVQVKAKDQLEKQSTDIKKEEEVKESTGNVEKQEVVTDSKKDKEENKIQDDKVVSRTNEDPVNTPESKNEEQNNAIAPPSLNDRGSCLDKNKEEEYHSEEKNINLGNVKEIPSEDQTIASTNPTAETNGTKSDSCEVIISPPEVDHNQENKIEELSVSTDPGRQKESTDWKSKDISTSPNSSSPQPSPSVLNQVATYEIRRKIAETFLAEEDELPELR